MSVRKARVLELSEKTVFSVKSVVMVASKKSFWPQDVTMNMNKHEKTRKLILLISKIVFKVTFYQRFLRSKSQTFKYLTNIKTIKALQFTSKTIIFVKIASKNRFSNSFLINNCKYILKFISTILKIMN